MEPIEYFRVVRRRWHIVAAAAVLALVVAFITTPSSSAGLSANGPFTATHTLVEDSTVAGGDTAEGGGPIIGLDLLALLTTTGEIPVRVVNRLGSEKEPAALAAQVTATPDTELGILTISSTGTDGDATARLANVFAEEALAYLEEESERVRQESLDNAESLADEQQQRVREATRQMRRISKRVGRQAPAAQLPDVLSQDFDYQLAETERTAALTEYNATQQRISELNAEVAQGSGLYTLEEAVPVPLVDEGFQPPGSPQGRAGLAVVIGLALGFGLILVLERVDTRIRTRGGAEEAFGLPVVAEVPRLGQRKLADDPVVLRSQPSSSAAEAYRILRLGLQLMPTWVLPTSPDDPTHLTASGEGLRRLVGEAASAILVTSAGEGEGKTTTAVNLAASFAEIGKNVLLLDCDFRNPQLHQQLGVAPAPGVTDYLLPGMDGSGVDEDRPTLHELAQASPIDGVWVVPSGRMPRNPGEVMEPGQDLIARAQTIADVVIVDAGPMLSVNDPSALLPDVDAVVLVARSGRTTADDARRSRELLSRLGAPLLGVTLVGVPGSALGSRSGYRHFANLPLGRYLPGRGRPRSRGNGQNGHHEPTGAGEHESVS